MTRNLYLGTDLNPIFQAPNLFALYAAVGAGWTQVQANDYPARAQALADEIAANRPDLVGLQEAMLFRTDVPPDGPATPAETVAYEFVDLLVDALADRALVYDPVSIRPNPDTRGLRDGLGGHPRRGDRGQDGVRPLALRPRRCGRHLATPVLSA
jgi:hypothetical protein